MKSQKGQSVVETALILPILLMILFGIVDFGRIFHAYLTLDHAGREAARAATIGTEDDDIRIKINNATGSLDKNKYPIGITIDPPGKEKRASGSNVTITLTYSIDFLTPFIAQTLNPVPLTNETVMRVE